MAKTIVLKGQFGQHEEGLASGIFSPGHLLKIDSDGKYLKHATEGGYAERAFAKEATLNQGKTVADAYAVGDVAFVYLALPGDVVQAVLKAGVSYAVGDQLISAGDGTLKKLSAAGSGVTVKQPIAVVETALNLSASGAVATLSPVRVL